MDAAEVAAKRAATQQAETEKTALEAAMAAHLAQQAMGAALAA